MININSNKFNQSHRRKNPLTGEWILVSPHRLSRPWQGQSEKKTVTQSKDYDDNCYLCPTNIRANGEHNPNYKDTFVFPNDFAAITEQDYLNPKIIDDPLFNAEVASGIAKVICFSPKHNLTMASMEIEDISKVINLWSKEVEILRKDYQWIQVFENKGSIMGCSNPHPHGQVWACNFLPTEPAKEEFNQRQYFEKYNKNMLLEYAKKEQKDGTRIVCENENWLVVVPFWATWPYETMVLPKFKCSHLNYLTSEQKLSLAKILKILLVKYDSLFDTSFPFSMGWHGSINAQESEYWQLHAHFYPPLLRSATVKKFMVGFEMLGESQRDITPEIAATTLRKL